MGAECFTCTGSVKIFDMTDSDRIYDMIADRYDNLKPWGTITAEFDEKNDVHVSTFSAECFYKALAVWCMFAFSNHLWIWLCFWW